MNDTGYIFLLKKNEENFFDKSSNEPKFKKVTQLFIDH